MPLSLSFGVCGDQTNLQTYRAQNTTSVWEGLTQYGLYVSIG